MYIGFASEVVLGYSDDGDKIFSISSLGSIYCNLYISECGLYLNMYQLDSLYSQYFHSSFPSYCLKEDANVGAAGQKCTTFFS